MGIIESLRLRGESQDVLPKIKSFQLRERVMRTYSKRYLSLMAQEYLGTSLFPLVSHVPKNIISPPPPVFPVRTTHGLPTTASVIERVTALAYRGPTLITVVVDVPDRRHALSKMCVVGAVSL